MTLLQMDRYSDTVMVSFFLTVNVIDAVGVLFSAHCDTIVVFFRSNCY